MLHEKLTAVLILALVSLISTVLVSEVTAQATQSAPNKGLAAIDAAAKANKYLFIFFYRQDDAQTRAAGEVFNSAVAAVAGRADSVVVPITDPSDAGIVTRFRVSQAPMPLVLVLAPNGAVTASFPTSFTKEQLLGGFGTSLHGKAPRGIATRQAGPPVRPKWEDAMECRGHEWSAGVQSRSTLHIGYRSAHAGPERSSGGAYFSQVGNDCPYPGSHDDSPGASGIGHRKFQRGNGQESDSNNPHECSLQLRCRLQAWAMRRRKLGRRRHATKKSCLERTL